jgi:hypothetical protein
MYTIVAIQRGARGDPLAHLLYDHHRTESHGQIRDRSKAGLDEHVTKPAELHRLEQILEGKKRMTESA